jgi:hypothetical protein
MDFQTAIVGATGFVGLWLAYHAWTVAIRTLYRQQLFRLRDELFLEAARGSISFDDTAYGMLRTIMQGLLWAAEDINLVQIVATSMSAKLLRGQTAPLAARFAMCVDRITDEKKAAVYRHYYRLTVLLVAMHFVRSFPLPVLGVLLVAIVRRFPGALLRRLLETAERGALVNPYVEGASRLPDGLRLAS